MLCKRRLDDELRTGLSGAFSRQNPLLLGGDDGSIFASWNCQALLHHMRQIRALKFRFITDKLRSSTVLALQEVHGTYEQMLLAFRELEPWFHVFLSSSGKADTGGVATLVSKKAVPDRHQINAESIIPGRSIMISIHKNNFRLRHLNVHNHNLTTAEIKKLETRIDEGVSLSRADPLSECTILHGDLNLSGEDEPSIILNSNLTQRPKDHQLRQARVWHKILDKLLYIDTSAYTHFHRESNTLSKLDRFYTSCPAWASTQLKIGGAACTSPVRLVAQGLSDHSPHAITIGPFRQQTKLERPIPSWISKTDRFREYHNQLCGAAGLDSLAAAPRWLLHKEIIVEAAALTRADFLAQDDLAPRALELSLVSLARLVLLNRSIQAESILRRCPLAQRHLVIRDHSVCFRDPAAFELDLSIAKSRNISTELDALRALLDSQQAPKFASKKIGSLEAKSRLWKSGARRSIINAIVVEDQAITDPTGMTKALTQCWKPTFSRQPDDDWCAAMEDLKNDIPNMREQFRETKPPDSQTILRSLENAKDRTPGKDTIPASAWATQAGAKTLVNVFGLTTLGYGPDIAFNDSITVFTPKGSQPGDLVSMQRSPADTRPLGLKNTDNKGITSAVNFSIMHVVSVMVTLIQRGFIKGRNFLHNIIELDALARRVSYGEFWASHPIFVFFDFLAAFPSIFHSAIHVVFKAAGAPVGFLNFLEVLYSWCMSYLTSQGVVSFFMRITSGILQGCPLSGTIFAIVSHASFSRIERLLLSSRNIVRCCADDLGAVLGSLEQLKLLVEPFRLTEKALGLRLKESKCVVVPLAPFTPQLRETILSWLREHIPAWAGFKVDSKGLYLGFWMGPSVRDEVFQDSFNKTIHRVRSIKTACCSSLHNVRAYNRDAISTCSYLAQLKLYPNSFVDRQEGVAASILKTPFRAFGKPLPFSSQIPHRPLTELRSMNLAALSRTAWATVQWQPSALSLTLDFLGHAVALQLDKSGLDKMRAAASKKRELPGGFSYMHRFPFTDWCKYSPAHWASEPMAVTLARAHAFFNIDKNLLKHIWREAGLSAAGRGYLRTRYSEHPALHDVCGNITWDSEQLLEMTHAFAVSEGKPQHIFHTILRDKLIPIQLEAFLSRKALRHVPVSGQAVECMRTGWPTLASRINSFHSQYLSFQALRLLSDAVCTPGRFQEKTACFFCKNSNSSTKLIHMLACDALWDTLEAAFPGLYQTLGDRSQRICRCVHELCYNDHYVHFLLLLAHLALFLSEVSHSHATTALEIPQLCLLAKAVAEHSSIFLQNGRFFTRPPKATVELTQEQTEARSAARAARRATSRIGWDVGAGFTLGFSLKGSFQTGSSSGSPSGGSCGCLVDDSADFAQGSGGPLLQDLHHGVSAEFSSGLLWEPGDEAAKDSDKNILTNLLHVGAPGFPHADGHARLSRQGQLDHSLDSSEVWGQLGVSTRTSSAQILPAFGGSGGGPYMQNYPQQVDQSVSYWQSGILQFSNEPSGGHSSHNTDTQD